MANKLTDLFVKLGLNSSSFNKGIDGAQKKTNKFGEGLKKIGGLIAGAFAVGAIVNFTKESVRLFNIQAQAENQLLVALKGRQDIQQSLIKQATQLQGKTLFGDEETIQAQALIAAFVKEEEQIKKVIPLVQDLAVAKGMQLAVSADLVSKTLGSSTNALSRYGIEVKGAVGSTERLESLMRGLNDAFGGQAEAAAKVGSGPLIQLSNQWGDLKESIGEAIITSDAAVESLQSLQRALELLPQHLEISKRALKAVFGVDLGENFLKSIDDINKSIDEFNRKQKEAVEATKRRQASIDRLNDGLIAGNELDKESFKLIGELKTETDELKKSLDLFNTSQDAEIQKTLAQIKANEELIKQLTTLRSTREATPATIATRGETPQIGLGFVPEEGLANMQSFFDKMDQQMKDFTDDYNEPFEASVRTMNEILEKGVEDMIGTLAEGFGRLAVGDIGFDEFGNMVLEQIGSFLGQMGQYLIAYGIAMSAFTKAFTNPLAAVAAGVVLVALGGAISGLASKGISGGNISSVGGGGASGGGFNPGGGTRAEDNRVVFELEGTKLIGVMQNTNRRRGIIA